MSPSPSHTATRYFPLSRYSRYLPLKPAAASGWLPFLLLLCYSMYAPLYLEFMCGGHGKFADDARIGLGELGK